MPIFMLFIAVLRNNFCGNGIRKFSTHILIFAYLASLRNSFSEKSLKFSKTMPTVPFPGA